MGVTVDASEVVNRLIENALNSKFAEIGAHPDSILLIAKNLQNAAPKVQISEINTDKMAIEEAVQALAILHDFMVAVLPEIAELVRLVHPKDEDTQITH
jgi:hypothetical protein